jgi:general secretion pathway protein A
MYNDYYSFNKKPFNITPNPEFLFLSDNHKEVFAHLLFGIRNHSGFIEVTGEVGTGKTTVLRTLLNQLDNEDHRLAFVFNPALSALELLQTINREFGIRADSASRSELQAALNQFLLQENRSGRTVVLVIDEAQNLQAEVLEEIRLLSNLETETDKLVQIVLVGQPELAATLARPELRQLSQRITVRYHLRPMVATETADYINHRLRVAGYSGTELFDIRAIRAIYHYSRGYPRLINVLCDRALLVGYTQDCRRITVGLIRQAIRELRRTTQMPATKPLVKGLAVLLVVGLLGFGAYLLHGNRQLAVMPSDSVAREPQPTSSRAPDSPPEPAVEPAVEPAAATSWADLTRARRQLAGIPWQQSLVESSRAVFTQWAIPASELPPIADARQFRQAGAEFGLDVLFYTGEFSGLLDIDLPVLLELYLPGEAEPRYLALLRVSGTTATVSPGLAGDGRLPLTLLQGLWSGRALVPWKNHADLGYVSQSGLENQDVRTLQELLQRAGYYAAALSGVYDQATLDSVTRFQSDRGLVQDGRVGPQTLIHIYQAAGRFQQPGLGETAAGGTP